MTEKTFNLLILYGKDTDYKDRYGSCTPLPDDGQPAGGDHQGGSASQGN